MYIIMYILIGLGYALGVITCAGDLDQVIAEGSREFKVTKVTVELVIMILLIIAWPYWIYTKITKL